MTEVISFLTQSGVVNEEVCSGESISRGRSHRARLQQEDLGVRLGTWMWIHVLDMCLFPRCEVRKSSFKEAIYSSTLNNFFLYSCAVSVVSFSSAISNTIFKR